LDSMPIVMEYSTGKNSRVGRTFVLSNKDFRFQNCVFSRTVQIL
jgi:hypothetical protein